MSDTASVDRSPQPTVDVCVVGSGVAGALVADGLAANGHEVVILEAGERFDRRSSTAVFERLEGTIRPEVSRADLWGMGESRDAFTTRLGPGVSFRLNEQRVKGVGGTTLHWSGYTPRLHEKDFELHTRYGHGVDWPIEYDALRPYYRQAERELGVAGEAAIEGPPRSESFPLPPFPHSNGDRLFADACDPLDITLAPMAQARTSVAYDGRPQCDNYGICTPFCPIGAQYSADVHVHRAEENGAIVIDEAPVHRLEHDAGGDSVRGALYTTPDGSVYEQRAEHFVIACGGIETPRLLLLSDSPTYPNGLANSSGTVGRYFHAGLAISTTARVGAPVQTEPVGFTTAVSHSRYEPIPDIRGSIRLEFQNLDPISPARVALSGGESDYVQQRLRPLQLTGVSWGDDLLDDLRALNPPSNDRVRVMSRVEQLPESSNRIDLDPNRTDDRGHPVPRITFEIGSYARETMESALELHRDIFNNMNARIVAEGVPGAQPIAYHHKGTTRMGTDSARSVVDPSCRTHDVENLWIASTSVFPTSGAVQPTLTAAALSLRLVEDLDDRL